MDVVGAELADLVDLGLQRFEGGTVDRFAIGGDSRVVLYRPPVDLVGPGRQEQVGADAGERRKRAVEIAIDRQPSHVHLLSISF
jgi:hypothetical protein